MSRFTPLDPKRQREGGWLPYTGYAFAAGDALVPLIGDEVPLVMATLPVAFHRQASGSYQLVAVQSLTANVNLCVHPDGRWLTDYVPAGYRGYPFRLLKEREGKRFLLCIDTESGLLLEDAREQGERFFDDAGELTERLADVKTFVESLERKRRLTQVAVEALATRELIVPWELKIQSEEGEQHKSTGLYHVDEQALNALSAEELAALRREGGLTLAYAQLLSQHRVRNLDKLYQLRQRLMPEAAQVEGLFGDDEEIGFNFDS